MPASSVDSMATACYACPRARWASILSWAAQLAVAVTLAQTLWFKFTYAPETQVIFASRGGRPAATASGVLELLSVVLVLLPRTAAFGACLALLIMCSAIFTHLTSLGIEVVDPATGMGDGGLLFGLALLVAAGSIVVLACRAQWPRARSASKLTLQR